MSRVAPVLLAVAVFALLAEPAVWLVRTWIHPGYDSDGGLVALLCLAIALRSALSGPAPVDYRGRKVALFLLLGAAAIRLVGRLLDISHVGAFALVLDVGALGLYLRLAGRPWAVHPAALAGLFSLTLPVEQLVQHVFAHPLRLLSAISAEILLRPFFGDLSRAGTLLVLPGQTLSIDLPCSGAQGLFLLGSLAFAFACRRVLRPRDLVAGAGAVLLGAWLANTLRIVALFAGPTEVLLAQPWHTVIGLGAIVVGASLPLRFATSLPVRAPVVAGDASPLRLSPVAAAGLAVLALAVAAAPHRPLDVSAPIPEAALPANLGDRAGTVLPLSSQETAYFETYGGHVERRSYADDRGPHAALLIRTTQPVRHLHGPSNCLRGAGHAVTRLGIRPGPIPTTVWKTVDPDGRAWRVETSLLSDTGATAETVSEVVWQWMRSPDATWMLVERVSPWGLCAADSGSCADFDRELFIALDLENHS